MKKFALLIIVLVLCLAGCTEEDLPPETDSTVQETVNIQEVPFTSTHVVLAESSDGIGSVYGLNKNMDVTERNGVTFAFEPVISMTDRAACIQSTEAVLRYLGVTAPLRIVIYSPDTYGHTFIQDGTIYTYRQDWESYTYVASLLQCIFGEYCSYGAAQGYAAFLSSRVFHWPLSIYEDEWTFAGNQQVLDLNLLTFRYTLFSTEDVNAARRIANTFVNEYILQKGEEAFQNLLIQSGSPETVEVFNQVLSEFYASAGIDYTPSSLLFRQGGFGYDYIVRTPYATFYMEKDWVDANAKLVPIYPNGFLHKNYADIHQYFQIATQEMAQYQSLLKPEKCNNDLNIYFTTVRRGSDYDAAKHAMSLRFCSGLSVQYIQSLVGPQVQWADWAYNGTIAYFSYYYDYYGNTMDTYVANMESNYETLRHYREYRKILGRDIDIFTDYTGLVHHYAWLKGYTDPQKGADSFVAYLIQRFGEEQVLDILLRTHDLSPYTYEELTADWNAYLESLFGTR